MPATSFPSDRRRGATHASGGASRQHSRFLLVLKTFRLPTIGCHGGGPSLPRGRTQTHTAIGHTGTGRDTSPGLSFGLEPKLEPTQADTHTHKHTDTDTHTGTDTHTDMHTQTHRHTDTQSHTHTHTHSHTLSHTRHARACTRGHRQNNICNTDKICTEPYEVSRNSLENTVSRKRCRRPRNLVKHGCVGKPKQA